MKIFTGSFLSAKLAKASQYVYQLPWCVPPWGYREFRTTVFSCLTSKIVKGPSPALFAKRIKDFLGMNYAIPVNRGRTAIEVALRAMGIEKNSEVIFPSYVCHAVLEAVNAVGAKPRFADIGPDLHVTAQTIAEAITEKTKCVIVPHLFGGAAPIDEIEDLLKNNGVRLIDDAAQSFGAKCNGRPVGTFGDFGIISCGAGKTLVGAAGGVLVTNDPELYDKAGSVLLPEERAATVFKRVLSFWVWRRLRRHTLLIQMILKRIIGYKSIEPAHQSCRMSNLDGQIGLIQLQNLHSNKENRKHNAQFLLTHLPSLFSYGFRVPNHDMLTKLVFILPEEGPIVHDFITNLSSLSIECQKGQTPLHFIGFNQEVSLPQTEQLWHRVVCVPIDVMYKPPQKSHNSGSLFLCC